MGTRREYMLGYQRQWRSDNPEKMGVYRQRKAESARNKRSGSPEEFAEMWEMQMGLCYLCFDPLPADLFHVHVDHDHSHCGSGKACAACRRGLACNHCNLLIGHAGDDPDRLRRIADHLELAQAGVRRRIAAWPKQEALPI